MSPTKRKDTTPRPITNAQLRALLRQCGACRPALDWLDDRDGATAWAECPDGSWMLWLAARVDVDLRLIVEAAAACAETALHFVPDGEDRPRLAIEAARMWAADPSEANRQRARRAATAATTTATTAATTAYAAYAAAYAAYAATGAATATTATTAATTAADAADAAAGAAYAATRQETRAGALKRCADLVRGHISYDAVLRAVRS